MNDWSFLTNHAHVLLAVAVDPEIRLRDLAAAVGVTERAAHNLVSDLIDAGYVSKHRVGRRNCYEIHPDLPLRRDPYRNHSIGEILEVLAKAAQPLDPAAGLKAAPFPPAKKVTKNVIGFRSAAPARTSRKELPPRP